MNIKKSKGTKSFASKASETMTGVTSLKPKRRPSLDSTRKMVQTSIKDMQMLCDRLEQFNVGVDGIDGQELSGDITVFLSELSKKMERSFPAKDVSKFDTAGEFGIPSVWPSGRLTKT